MTFHYLVETRTAVDDLLARAEAAGGTVTAPAQDAQWGGYFGYFTDSRRQSLEGRDLRLTTGPGRRPRAGRRNGGVAPPISR